MNENMQNIVRFYLDQNVIDYLIKGNLDLFQEFIDKSQNIEIVYSYVTLKEIARIENAFQRNHYLDYLKKASAKYFWIDKDDLAHFEDFDPYEVFNANISDYKIAEEVMGSMLAMTHKLFGGKKDVPFEQIAILQKESFSRLLEYINTTLDSLEEQPALKKEVLKENSQLMNALLVLSVDKLIEQINNSNYNNDTSLNDLRKLWDIKVDKVNEIESPNVIGKIWHMIKDGIKNSDINLEYHDLFGDGLSKYFPNQKTSMSMKVNWLYNLLNIIGYYPDKNVRSDRKFIPFINDQQHVGVAIYSDFFVTRDKRLMKKAEAVYEHLKIGTRIIFIQ